jgi:hypothetical protein
MQSLELTSLVVMIEVYKSLPLTPSSVEMSLFPFVISVVCDYITPEILARLAKCSNEVKQITTPVLERKMLNAEEMNQLVLRVFPTIKYLPAVNEFYAAGVTTAGYYRHLLDSYYNPDPELGPCDVEVNHMVGCIITAPNMYNEERGFMLYVPNCANTAVRRARVLKAIGEWTKILTRRGVDVTRHIVRLDALALALRTDFALSENTVDSFVRDVYIRGLGGGI